MSVMGPRTALAWELQLQGKTTAEIGKLMGLTRGGAAVMLHNARAALKRGEPYVAPLEDGIDDTSGERCRCGLRLPCNNCVGRAESFLARRETFFQPSGGINGGRRGAQRPE